MKKSGIEFHPNTMPIWGWHKDEFPTGFQTVAPHLYDDVLERARRHTIGEYKDFVGLFLEVPPDEVYLSNFIKWDFYLFSERNDDDIENFHNWTQEQQGWYLAENAEAEYYFSQIDDIEGDVRVQGIFPEIRKDMIVQVLEESKTVSS